MPCSMDSFDPQNGNHLLFLHGAFDNSDIGKGCEASRASILTADGSVKEKGQGIAVRRKAGLTDVKQVDMFPVRDKNENLLQPRHFLHKACERPPPPVSPTGCPEEEMHKSDLCRAA